MARMANLFDSTYVPRALLQNPNVCRYTQINEDPTTPEWLNGWSSPWIWSLPRLPGSLPNPNPQKYRGSATTLLTRNLDPLPIKALEMLWD
ncbi:MAG: hypothetical protein LQ347_003049 [Umbilicaria vellea]|nr:MAG: hypothetical protein LQ347_003049 [Umbilicaria vellea]